MMARDFDEPEDVEIERDESMIVVMDREGALIYVDDANNDCWIRAANPVDLQN